MCVKFLSLKINYLEQLIVNGGTHPPKVFSNSSATAKQSTSRFLVATTCIPKGKPSLFKPIGT